MIRLTIFVQHENQNIIESNYTINDKGRVSLKFFPFLFIRVIYSLSILIYRHIYLLINFSYQHLLQISDKIHTVCGYVYYSNFNKSGK